MLAAGHVAGEAGPLVDLVPRSISLPSGARVRIRLPHGSDRPGLRDLHARAGVPLDDLGLRRLLRVDPRRRCALVATAWLAGAETMVGFAACDLPDGGGRVIVADEALGPELHDALDDALRRRTSRVA